MLLIRTLSAWLSLLGTGHVCRESLLLQPRHAPVGVSALLGFFPWMENKPKLWAAPGFLWSEQFLLGLVRYSPSPQFKGFTGSLGWGCGPMPWLVILFCYPSPSSKHPAQPILSGDIPPLLPEMHLTAPSLLGGRQQRSGRLSGSKQTASSCSCSRRPSKKPSTSPSKPTPSVSTTPLSLPSRTSSLGLTTPPRSPVSPLSLLLVNKASTHW